MFDDALISVIIPVYNVEKYIKECLDSVIAQTYPKLEIIVVDDGSQDGSGKILDEYAVRDSRIKVIHRENSGPSAARNTGIRAAAGEYLCFVDSDDYISCDYVEKLYEPIRGKKEVFSFCNYTSSEGLGSGEGQNASVTQNEFKRMLYDTKAKECVMAVVVWNKLYSRDIWEKVSYPEGKLHEDEAITYDILMNSKEIVYVPKTLYYYRRREDSIMGKENKYGEGYLDVLPAYEGRVKKAIERGDVSFAEICVRNTLYKLIEMSEQFGKADSKAKATIASEYRRIYKNYSKYMNCKRRLKYWVKSFKL